MYSVLPSYPSGHELCESLENTARLGWSERTEQVKLKWSYGTARIEAEVVVTRIGQKQQYDVMYNYISLVFHAIFSCNEILPFQL